MKIKRLKRLIESLNEREIKELNNLLQEKHSSVTDSILYPYKDEMEDLYKNPTGEKYEKLVKELTALVQNSNIIAQNKKDMLVALEEINDSKSLYNWYWNAMLKDAGLGMPKVGGY